MNSVIGSALGQVGLVSVYCDWRYRSALGQVGLVSVYCDWRYRVSAGTGWPGVGLLWLAL